MNIKNLILGGAFALSLGFMAVGCNENVDNPIDPGTGNLNGVTGLEVTSLSATSVGLKWVGGDTATSTASVNYMVKWTTTSGTVDSASQTVASTSVNIGNLLAGREYTFTVTTMRGTDRSSSAKSPSINWAGATRTSGSTTLRMYESSSSSPSGLSLSAAGGPANFSVRTGTEGFVQLAMYVGTDNTVIVGPLYGIPEYNSSSSFDAAKVDSSTYISASTFVVPSLDAWYMNMSLDKMISAGSNGSAYEIPAASQGNAQGFVVRFGAAGNYRYARVLLKKGSTGILQGTSPNRYVETEISLQSSPNLPYAKGSVGQLPPVGVYAKRLK